MLSDLFKRQTSDVDGTWVSEQKEKSYNIRGCKSEKAGAGKWFLCSECQGSWTCGRQLAAPGTVQARDCPHALFVQGFLGLQWMREGDSSHQQRTIQESL